MSGDVHVRFCERLGVKLPRATHPVLARYRDHGFDGVLAKPFTIPDLRRVLREVEEGTTETHQQAWPGYVDELSLSA